MKPVTEYVADAEPISYAGHRYPPAVISYACGCLSVMSQAPVSGSFHDERQFGHDPERS